MASRFESLTITSPGSEALAEHSRFVSSASDDSPTVPIPRWLMVLAARGEVTLRVAVDLEDDPLGDDEPAVGDDTETRHS
jgi:hypothetical protein